MYRNMGPKTTPSMISKGGYQILPPPGVGRNRHPLGNRVNPVNDDVSDSELHAGGSHFDTTSENIEGAL